MHLLDDILGLRNSLVVFLGPVLHKMFLREESCVVRQVRAPLLDANLGTGHQREQHSQ